LEIAAIVGAKEMSGSLRPKLLIAAMFLLVGMASAQHCRKIDIDRSSVFCTVPDPGLTPGEMDPALACVSNPERPRTMTNSKKKAILTAYGYPANTDR
jgi:hypothetical protein